MAARVLRPRDRGVPAALQDWIKTRPPEIQALAAEFPPGIVVTDARYRAGAAGGAPRGVRLACLSGFHP